MKSPSQTESRLHKSKNRLHVANALSAADSGQSLAPPLIWQRLDNLWSDGLKKAPVTDPY